MTKWHQTTGTYRSPPFADPLHSTIELAASIKDKRDILLRNLLTNTAEAGDIPFDSPVAPMCTIFFPPIIEQDVQKAILKAGNTAPGSNEIPTKVLQAAWPVISKYVLFLF